MSDDYLLKRLPEFAAILANYTGPVKLSAAIHAASMARGALDDRFLELLLATLEADPEDVDSWPLDYEDTRFDWYDNSFELKGVTPSTWELTLEQATQLLQTTGFDRCWVCYADGSEISYSIGHKGPRLGN